MKGRRGLGLKGKLLVAFALFLLAPSLAIGVASYQSTKANVGETMQENAEQTTGTLHSYLQQFVATETDSIAFLASTIDLSDGINDEVEQRLVAFSEGNDRVEEMYLVTREDDSISYSEDSGVQAVNDLQSNQWYRDVMGRQVDVSVSEPLINEETEEVTLVIGAPTPGFEAVVGVELDIAEVLNRIEETTIGSTGYVFLANSEGRVLTHPEREVGSFLPADLSVQISEESGELTYVQDGVEREFSFQTVQPVNWKLVGAMLPNEVEALVAPIVRTVIIVSVVTLLLGGAIVYGVTRSIASPIGSLARSAQTISKGDLREQEGFMRASNDEVGVLAASFNEMRLSIVKMMSQIREKSMYLAASSEELQASTEQNMRATEQITMAMQEVSTGVDEQAASIEQGNVAATNVSQGVTDIKSSAQQVNYAAEEAATAVHEGQEGIHKSVRQMDVIHAHVSDISSTIDELRSQSETITQVIRVISEISEQTNLLALNASIEAAHAGEHGRGFAVVAEEVRKLAEESAKAAQTVQGQISAVQNGTIRAGAAMKKGKSEVERGVTVIQQAGEAFSLIQTNVDDVRAKIASVTSEAGQMSEGTEQFLLSYGKISEAAETTSSSVQNVSAATEEQLASMEEISSSSTNLTQLADELEEMVKMFKW
ncbi:methyl-accepting chemotaxis protein [Shouchella shacheensis]|uniref:methyl-accepting chemotaxis protein n=1 Tax=Shouchella shacheensis TaxID=1649580 RepID=UPI00073FC285|nr:methyl-accepting chemotaxis protein [Shouchella shacheensis]